jgi:hypothetical protein
VKWAGINVEGAWSRFGTRRGSPQGQTRLERSGSDPRAGPEYRRSMDPHRRPIPVLLFCGRKCKYSRSGTL